MGGGVGADEGIVDAVWGVYKRQCFFGMDAGGRGHRTFRGY